MLPEGHRFLRNYKDTFIKTKTPAVFEGSDIEESGICIFSEDCARVPDFAANLERELDRKPGLDSDVICFFDHSSEADALTGQCRHMTVLNLFATLNFWTHIWGLSREGPSTMGHQRKLPPKVNLTGASGNSK